MSFSVERGSAGSSSVFFLHLYWIRIFELTWEFYRTDALLVIQSSMSKRWRKDEVLTLTRENYYLALSFLHLLWDCSGEMLFCLCQFCIAGVQCPINTNYNYSTKYYCKIAYVCKRLSGWIRYDNYIHITQPSAKYMYLIAMFCSPTANFIRHMVTWCWQWARDQNTWPMTVFWSRAHRQRHVTICLMKFAVGERNVAIRYVYFALGCVIWIWLS